ncbi:MAG: hypothetical protein VW080_03450 [Flavobacteriaceae bacterium]
MKKLILLLTVGLFVSCGVKKNIDPYAGTYNITIFEIDNIGDLPLEWNLVKTETGYSSIINPQEGADMQEVEVDVDSTTQEENTFTVEAYAGGYDIYLELTIEGDEVSGNLMGMFDITGERIQKEN